ncbi:uncharacterized protein [Acropora muricata]|uniref:uncharacterized protein isoform X1 n=1 Tax=Acropora muricata TaxID=159855 RepID=UPI0034E4DCFB
MHATQYWWTLLVNFIINTQSVRPEQYPPRFGKKPKVQNNVQVGHNIRLRCSVKGDPPPRLTWVKDQKPLQFSSRIRLISRDNGIVKIKNTQLVDAGYYTCIAANSLGSVNATLELHVRRGSSNPSVPTNQAPTARFSGKHAPPSFTVQSFLERRYRAWPASHTIRLKCEAIGAPPLQFRWLKDGQRLLSRRMDPYLNSSLWFLRLRDVVPDDSGKYTCIVTNPYGSINHTYTLKVVAKPRSRPFLQRHLPRNTTVKLGDNATMECIVLVSGTLPDFRWLKWDKNITSQPKMNGMMKANGSNKLIDPVHYKTIKDGEHHGIQLDIYNVSDNDFGLYTCFVSNHIGYDYNSAFLIKSEERPRPTTSEQYPPRFGKKPEVQNNVQVGHDIRLRCSVKGDPPPRLTWVKDQKPLQFSSRIRLISRDNGIVEIKNTQLVDAGYYTCIAANSLGSVNATLELHVRQVCDSVLGLESGLISDLQISASSRWDSNHAPSQARLKYQETTGKSGAWAAAHNNDKQWLQVFLGNTKITRVATQGRNYSPSWPYGSHSQWVTKYKLQYSNNGVTFQYYKEQGEVKEFIGNSDRDTVVENVLNPPIEAKFIRFQPTAWHGHISMRVELYGCRQACLFAFDSQLSASSQWDRNHAPSQGKLNYQESRTKPGAWAAAQNNDKQWLQVDLGSQKTVRTLATQGRNYDPHWPYGPHAQWVTNYKLQYSNDGLHFQHYKEQGAVKEFAGNTNRDTEVYHDLNPPVSARYFRFRPTSWHGHISMRVGLFGCPDR